MIDILAIYNETIGFRTKEIRISVYDLSISESEKIVAETFKFGESFAEGFLLFNKDLWVKFDNKNWCNVINQLTKQDHLYDVCLFFTNVLEVNLVDVAKGELLSKESKFLISKINELNPGVFKINKYKQEGLLDEGLREWFIDDTKLKLIKSFFN